MSDAALVKPSVNLATDGPEVVVGRLLKDMKSTHDAFPENFGNGGEEYGKQAIQWIDQMTQYVEFCSQAEGKFSTAQAIALAYIQHHWDDLPLEFRKKFNLSFYDYATRLTGKAIATIDNYIRAIETFFFEGIAPSTALDVPVRDIHKRPIIDAETGEIKTQPKLWNPMAPPISKLVLARAQARKGKLTRAQWEMLMDDGCTFEHLQIELARTESGGSPGSSGSGLRYRLEGAGLFAQEGQEVAELGELQFGAYYDDPDSLAHRALNRLMLLLGIDLDEKIIQHHQLKQEVNRANHPNR